MNRRDFCKTVSSALIAWGLNPILAFADNGNKREKIENIFTF